MSHLEHTIWEEKEKEKQEELDFEKKQLKLNLDREKTYDGDDVDREYIKGRDRELTNGFIP